MGIHIKGFLNHREPLPHHMYFCGTFFGFTIISIIGDVGEHIFYVCFVLIIALIFVCLGTAICTGASTPYVIEAIVASLGAFFYILSSVFSMHDAEMDFHLMYLSDLEEERHPFFLISKAQVQYIL